MASQSTVSIKGFIIVALKLNGKPTFIGQKLHRHLLLLDGALQHTSVVHDSHLAVQSGPARLRAQVLHQDAELGVGTHPGPLTLHVHLHAHILGHGRGVDVWLAAIATGSLDSDAFLFRA